MLPDSSGAVRLRIVGRRGQLEGTQRGAADRGRSQEETTDRLGADTELPVHLRRRQLDSSSEPTRFAAVQEGVPRHCPGMIVQFSTGGRGRDPAARGSALYLKPDVASLSTGSVNFPSMVYENHPALIGDLATAMNANGVLPEIEIFDLSHLHTARRLADGGLIGERPHIQSVMGVQNALPAEERFLDVLLRKQNSCSTIYLDGGRNRPQPNDRDELGVGTRSRRSAYRT